MATGRKSSRNCKKKYLRVTDETICPLQVALAATTMGLNEDSDNNVMAAKRLSSRLTAMKEPVTKRHFTDTIAQGLLEKYQDIKLTTYKDS